MKALIATVSANGTLGEGTKSTSSWTTQEDKKWFEKITKQLKNVVIGRKTYKTLSKKILSNRVLYILTRQPELLTKTDSIIPITFEDFIKLDLDSYCVAGGYAIYKLFEQIVDTVYLSHHKRVTITGPKFVFPFDQFTRIKKIETQDLIKEIYTRN